MHTPATALTWEICRRHRKRLLTAVFLFLGFALFYSKLCALMGLNLDSPNALDSIVEKIPMHGDRPDILRLMALMILSCAPLACMVMTLFYVVWVFTFTEANPKEPFSFPMRLFTLPISTKFLASWLMAAGTAAVILVYLGWTQLVHLPRIEVFDGFNDCLAWVTFLILSQAIVWSLNAFPFTRVLMLITAAFFLLAHPDFEWYRSLTTHQTAVQLALLLIGCGTAFVGLDKIRHGSWQRWCWQWRIPSTLRTELKIQEIFNSAARAQFWFEWRRHGRKLFYCVCALSGLPVLVMIPEFILHPGPVNGDTTQGLIIYLLAVPLFIHFCQGVSHERSMPQFIAIRPINNGEIAVAQWKATALSTALSWVVTLVLLGVVAVLGDLSTIKEALHALPQYEQVVRPLIPFILLGMVFLTWGFVADRVWVGATMGTWIHRAYAASIVLILFGLGLWWIFAIVQRNAGFREMLFGVLPGLIIFLTVLKFFLGQWAFRVALKRRLVARSTMIKYFFIWATLAVVFLVPVAIVCHREKGIIPLCLGILLMLPLARIGFAPIALNLGRHR